MNEQERKDAFIKELEALQDKYGFQVQAAASIRSEQLGEALLLKPIIELRITAIPDWQPEVPKVVIQE